MSEPDELLTRVEIRLRGLTICEAHKRNPGRWEQDVCANCLMDGDTHLIRDLRDRLLRMPDDRSLTPR